MKNCPKCGSENIKELSDGTILCQAEHCLSVSAREDPEKRTDKELYEDTLGIPFERKEDYFGFFEQQAIINGETTPAEILEARENE
jgi:hypothetical protein